MPEPRLPIKRLLACAVLVISSVVGCHQLDTWQRQAIFSPEAEQQRWWREPPAGTREYDLRLPGGDTVHAWYWQSPKPDAPAVLYLHGARWNLNGSAFRMEAWTDMGYSVLAIDYRGFGKSTPTLPSQRSANEDALAALQELARQQPDPTRRFIYGHSLGGAIAIDLASRTDAPPFAGMIVESSFTSVGAMLSTMKYGWVPGVNWLVTQPFDSLTRLATLKTPILFIHGTADRVVPHTMSDQLYEGALAVAPTLKRLVKIEGASHSGAVRSGAIYREAVASFMRDAAYAYAPPEVRLGTSSN
ncbi:MAG: alpha/beta fold hydrolase [Burkholderiaceae bacterium]|jgi:alpha-beta hydrolase superfamily lysophospholipase|nr:alpha/beta fold hydrolase [Burkholderiaceae bacterium]